MNATFGRRGTGARLARLVLAVFGGLALLVALSGPSGAGAGGDRRIEVDYSIEYVLLEGYPQADMPVLIEVYRNATAAPNSGVRIGSFEGTTSPDARAGNILEVNHLGGGQFPNGDCWQGPSTPNIQPGDKVQATLLDAAGERTSQVDYTFVRDLTYTDNGGSISGRALGVEENGQFDLTRPISVGDPEAGGAFIDARRVLASLPGGRVDAEITPDANGNFTADLPGTGGEVSVQFVSPNADGEGDESTVAGPTNAAGGEEPLVGCPPLAEYEILSVTPEIVNSAFVAGEDPLLVSGVSFDAESVSVSVDDNNPATSAVTAEATRQPASGAQTWEASLANAGIEALDDGNLAVRATYTIPGGTDPLTSTKTVVKDAQTPAVPGTPDLADGSDLGFLNGDDVTSDATPTFTGTAETGSTVEILVDGEVKGSATATGGSYSVTTSTLAPGDALSVTARASDVANNVSEASAALTIRLDTTPPNVSANPPGGTYIGDQSVSLSADETSRIHFTRNGTTPTVNSPLYTTPIQLTGNTTIRYLGVDVAGNRSEVGTEAYVIRANTAPTITSFRPAQGSSTADRTPLIAATVRDAQSDLAKSNIRLFVDGARKTNFSYNRTTDRMTYTSTNLTPGRHTVRIVATDPQGLATSRTWRFNVR